jgi:EAL domain-containing protein (putative c-di-GMP-specific phosphodiesterase class I)
MENVFFEFQPIIKDNSIYGYEALMRIRNTTITDTIRGCRNLMDYYNLEKKTFFEALREYKRRGYEEKVFLNSFPNIFLKNSDMEEFISEHGDILDRVVLEVLESPNANRYELDKKIAFAKKYGCLMAIDDYGTGNHIVDSELLLQPDIIKLDRSLISNINTSKERQNDLYRIIQNFDNANISVLAEGVETKAELETMKDLGATLFQGYYISRPT